VAVAAVNSVAPTAGQEFRVETEIFLDEQKEPVVETLTIFTRGIVYDFLRTGVEEITLFDRDRQRLVLMDSKREVKAVLPMDGITSFVAEMKVHLSDERHQHFLSESAEIGEDDEGWLTVSNERIVYRAKGVSPAEQAMALEYQDFADWYARLNAMRPGNLPPFLRLQLNAEVAKRGLIPKTVERTVADNRLLSNKKQVVRSQHLANWRLSHTDRKLIDRASTHLATFREVSFLDYIQMPAVAARSPERH
jgi:hypothetical protein